jgi:hypothetical protein
MPQVGQAGVEASNSTSCSSRSIDLSKLSPCHTDLLLLLLLFLALYALKYFLLCMLCIVFNWQQIELTLGVSQTWTQLTLEVRQSWTPPPLRQTAWQGVLAIRWAALKETSLMLGVWQRTEVAGILVASAGSLQASGMMAGRQAVEWQGHGPRINSAESVVF